MSEIDIKNRRVRCNNCNTWLDPHLFHSLFNIDNFAFSCYNCKKEYWIGKLL